jgi:hypothetical protein
MLKPRRSLRFVAEKSQNRARSPSFARRWGWIIGACKGARIPVIAVNHSSGNSLCPTAVRIS